MRAMIGCLRTLGIGAGVVWLVTASVSFAQSEVGSDPRVSVDTAPDPEYRVLAAFRRVTLERELNEAGAEGFRLQSMVGDRERVAVMGRSPGEQGAWSYRVLGYDRQETLECELNNASREGYAYRKHVMRDHENLFVLERHDGSTTVPDETTATVVECPQ